MKCNLLVIVDWIGVFIVGTCIHTRIHMSAHRPMHMSGLECAHMSVQNVVHMSMAHAKSIHLHVCAQTRAEPSAQACCNPPAPWAQTLDAQLGGELALCGYALSSYGAVRRRVSSKEGSAEPSTVFHAHVVTAQAHTRMCAHVCACVCMHTDLP